MANHLRGLPLCVSTGWGCNEWWYGKRWSFGHMVLVYHHGMLPRTQSWILHKVGFSNLPLAIYVYRRVTPHTPITNQIDRCNEPNAALNSSTKLAAKHVRMVFLKSMSCSSCDFEVIGFFPTLRNSR